MYKDFWSRVNALIKNRGTTQKALSLECGFKERRIETLSSYDRSPDVNEVLQIARALKVTVEYLVTGEGCNGLLPNVPALPVPTVKVKCIVPSGARLPEYKTAGAAGADICALLPSPVTIPAGGIKIIPTGLKMEVPLGYEAQVRPRSGLAAKYGITVVNTPGTIDSDYRGEICVIMANLGQKPFTVNNGERIAQLVISPVTLGDFASADALSDTERGEGGFGSTGV